MTNFYCNQKSLFSKEFLKNQSDPQHFSFYKKVRSTLRATKAWQNAKKVMVCVSGGVDSSVLLHELVCYCVREEGPKLCAVHVHHGVRGETADRDAKSAQTLAHQHGVAFETLHLHIQEHSRPSEATLRQARMQALIKHQKEQGFDLIVLGHHQQDQAETILFRLFRGTDLRGLMGMQVLRDELWFRPLLLMPKDQIVQEARHRGLLYIEDETNQDTSYARNYIRHQLLPQLKTQFNPDLEHHLETLGASMSQIHAYVLEQAKKVREEVVLEHNSLSCTQLRPHPPVLRKHVYVLHIKDVCEVDELARNRLEEIDALLDAKNLPKEIQLPGGVRVARSKDVLTFTKSDETHLQ